LLTRAPSLNQFAMLIVDRLHLCLWLGLCWHECGTISWWLRSGIRRHQHGMTRSNHHLNWLQRCNIVLFVAYVFRYINTFFSWMFFLFLCLGSCLFSQLLRQRSFLRLLEPTTSCNIKTADDRDVNLKVKTELCQSSLVHEWLILIVRLKELIFWKINMLIALVNEINSHFPTLFRT